MTNLIEYLTYTFNLFNIKLSAFFRGDRNNKENIFFFYSLIKITILLLSTIRTYRERDC